MASGSRRHDKKAILQHSNGFLSHLQVGAFDRAAAYFTDELQCIMARNRSRERVAEVIEFWEKRQNIDERRRYELIVELQREWQQAPIGSEISWWERVEALRRVVESKRLVFVRWRLKSIALYGPPMDYLPAKPNSLACFITAVLWNNANRRRRFRLHWLREDGVWRISRIEGDFRGFWGFFGCGSWGYGVPYADRSPD